MGLHERSLRRRNQGPLPDADDVTVQVALVLAGYSRDGAPRMVRLNCDQFAFMSECHRRTVVVMPTWRHATAVQYTGRWLVYRCPKCHTEGRIMVPASLSQLAPRR